MSNKSDQVERLPFNQDNECGKIESLKLSDGRLKTLSPAKWNQAESSPTVWRRLVWEMQWSGTINSRVGDSLSERVIQLEIDVWQCRRTVGVNKNLKTVFLKSICDSRRNYSNVTKQNVTKNHISLNHDRKNVCAFSKPIFYRVISSADEKQMELRQHFPVFCSQLNFFVYHRLFLKISWCRWKTNYSLSLSDTLSTMKAQMTFQLKPMSTPIANTVFSIYQWYTAD